MFQTLKKKKRIDSISRNHFLCSSVKVYHEITAIQSPSGSTSNSSSLAISTTSAVTSSTEVLNLSKSSIKVRVNLFQTSVNVYLLTSCHKSWMFLMYLEWWILSRRFSNYFAQIHWSNHYLWQQQLYKVFKIISLKVEITPWSMGCRKDAVLAGMKTTIISLSISIRALGWPGALSMSSKFFFK